MTNFKKLSKYPHKFLAMTGYTVEEFLALLPFFLPRLEAYLDTHTLKGKVRTKRRYAPYENATFRTVEDMLLFILIYLKQGTTQEMHATLFGMHQSDANVWIHVLHPILNQALADLDALPARKAENFNPEDEDEIYLHDGTERPISRPKDKDDQTTYYSGKKKRHTIKNIVVSTPDGRIIFLSFTCEGKKHDKKAADEADYELPEGSKLFQDAGFQSFVIEGVTIIQPKKKPRGEELSPEDKESNRIISKVRVRVEHAIGGVKRYRIVKDTIRNWKEGFRDQVMETCCGLHNFRLRFRPWHYAPITA